MQNTLSIAALAMFTVAPFAAFSIRTRSSRRQKAKESEKAWEMVAKFIV
jgi:hypothetical protein